MSEQSRTKRVPPDFPLHRQASDSRRCQVVGERQILELISLGAPLPGILNKLCMMIDVRIGNVVSIVSLPDSDENHFCTMTRSALQVGLEMFSARAIVSAGGNFLGRWKSTDAIRAAPPHWSVTSSSALPFSRPSRSSAAKL